MKAVCDAGPMMALAKIGAIHLLSDVYAETLVPEAVYREVVIVGSRQSRPDAIHVRREVREGRLTRVPMSDADVPLRIATLPIDAGEKQVLALTLREKADVALLDDGAARREARSLGLNVKGTLGVLVQARVEGVASLKEVEDLIRLIQLREDIWIADGLCIAVLAALSAAP